MDAAGTRGLRAQRREWRAQRVGWVLMALGLGVAMALGEGMIVLRAVAIYLFMLVVLRVSGKRRLAELTPFDLVLLLIIAEVTEPAMLPEDKKDFGPVVVAIVSLVAADLAMGWLRWRSPTASQVIEGQALVLVTHGEVHDECLAREHITRDEILEAARAVGLTRMTQIRFAVLESDGQISVIARRAPRFRPRA